MRPRGTPIGNVALRAWRDLIGECHVVDDPATLDTLSRATYATLARPVAVVCPRDVSEVSGVVRIASEHGVQLHPTSRGMNIGYGSRVPPVDGAAILDLSRLNRIRHVDATLGTLTLEPGVTFRDVFAHLARHGHGWTIGATGGPFEGSPIGNLVQRGLSTSEPIDVWLGAQNLEVVLSDGTPVSLGRPAWPGAPDEERALGNGPGPALEGLFTQSNWGIVTAATISLIRVPEHSCFIFWRAECEHLSTVVDTLRRLRQSCRNIDMLRSYNQNKLLAGRGIAPETEEPDGYFAEAAAAAAARGADVAPWQGVVGLQATTWRQLIEVARWVAAQLADSGVDVAVQRGSVIVDPTARDDWSDAIDLDGAMGSIEWKLGTPLATDAIGIVWFAPTLPFTGADVTRATELATRITADFRMEPILELIAINERELVMTVALTWDRRIPGADERALSCHAALTREFAAVGSVPYRLGVGTSVPEGPTHGLAELWRRLDASLNPRGTFARTAVTQAVWTSST
jgi:4-cresol dehydrogenase (hydroxylating) flavoprotein subunit